MARNFTAGSDELSNASAPITAAPFTISLWMNKDDTSTDNCWGIATAGQGTHFWRMLLISSVVRFDVDNGAPAAASSTGTYTTGVWTHCCGVERSATDRSCYRDGANRGNLSGPSIIPVGVDETTIGATSPGVSGSFGGDLAEVAIWDTDLDDDEVAALGTHRYSALLVRPQSLVFYDRMVRGVDAAGDGDGYDIIGGLTMTEGGTVGVATHPPIIYPASMPIIVPGAPAAGHAIRLVGGDRLTSKAGGLLVA